VCKENNRHGSASAISAPELYFQLFLIIFTYIYIFTYLCTALEVYKGTTGMAALVLSVPQSFASGYLWNNALRLSLLAGVICIVPYILCIYCSINTMYICRIWLFVEQRPAPQSSGRYHMYCSINTMYVLFHKHYCSTSTNCPQILGVLHIYCSMNTMFHNYKCSKDSMCETSACAWIFVYVSICASFFWQVSYISFKYYCSTNTNVP